MVATIKDLERLLKLCRKQGVLKITTSEVSLELGELPVKYSAESIEDGIDQIDSRFDEPLTNEELVAFASGGN